MKIRSGDKEAQRLVNELVSVLEAAGGFFHSALQLDVRGADFSYSLRKKLSAGEELVMLPLRCMPLLDDFSWSLDSQDNLQWAPVDSPLAEDYALHQQIVDVLVRLYNCFGKVSDCAKNSPVVQFAEKTELVESLLDFAQERPFKEKLAEGREQLLIHAFWHSRIFSDYQTGRIHLIPLMEFFDHHIFTENFYWDNLQGGARALYHSYTPVEGKKGVFARYEIMDNLHAFVKYGFVDDKTFFVQSQPLSVQLNDKVQLQVGYQSASGNQCHISGWKVEPAYGNSLMYRARLEFLADRVFMPFMLVPPVRHMPAFDEALVAQLKEIEGHLDIPAGELANADVILQLKKCLVEENLEAYRKIKNAAREAALDRKEPAVRMLKNMLEHQLNILAEFRQTLI